MKTLKIKIKKLFFLKQKFFWSFFIILIIVTLIFWQKDILNFAHLLKGTLLINNLLKESKENKENLSFFQENQKEKNLGFEFENQKKSDFEKEQFLEKRNENLPKSNSLIEIQKQLEDISEKIDILETKIIKLKKENSQEKNEELDELKDKENEEYEEETDKELGQEIGQFFCPISFDHQPLLNQVIFNEIAWMGYSVDKKGIDEWIELKNISNKEIDLNGWQIQTKNGKIKIIFENIKISPNSFLLLERNNDDVVSDIKADFIYIGALKNTDEALYLFDKNCQLQDFVEANPFWPAGDNQSKKTMERKNDFTWQTSLNPRGTPKKENSLGDSYFGIKNLDFQRIIYPSILISEVKISEKRGDKNIFVEIYNPNDKEVDLTGWYLQKKNANSSDYLSFVSKNQFQGKKILAKDYLLLTREGSIFLELADIVFEETLTGNNTICLKNPNQEIADCLDLPLNLIDKSWGRIYDKNLENYLNQFEAQFPTPKQKNNRLPLVNFSFSPQNPKEKEEVLFDASISFDPDDEIKLFYWDFGDNHIVTTTFATTTHFYQFSGQFLINLTVFDERGAFSFITSSIEILKIPQPILKIPQNKFIFYIEKEKNIFSQGLIIENKGEKELNWEISSSKDWLFFDPNFGTILPQSSSSVEIFVDILNLNPGKYSATAVIECFGCQKNFEEIFIELTIFPKTKKSVIINEIGWMGTKASDWDEWIELYNTTNSPIDLMNWKIKKNNEDFIEISTSSFIFDFYLLERAEKATNIPGDFIYGGKERMKNSECEILSLYDNFNELIDETTCLFNGQWPAGTAVPDYFSMERIDANISGMIINNWSNNNGIIKNGFDANNNPINGTPRAKNSVSN